MHRSGALAWFATQYARAVLQRALNRAVKWELVTRNVVLATDPPTSKPREITPLTVEEARRLLAAVAGHRLEALYRIALALGLRRGEVLGLLWSNIDRTKKTLRITGALQRVQGKLERSEPKTRSGARTLLLPDVLVELLAEHQRRQAEERLLWGAEWQEHDLVFPTERGTPMEPSNLNRHFKAALKRAGLPATTRFHDLRHSCATFLIAQGVQPRVVMEILGHSQISLTMNTYGHVLPETQREATTKVADLFGTRDPKPGAPSDTEPEQVAEAAPEERAAEQAELPAKPTHDHEQPPSAVERLDGNADERLYNAEDDIHTPILQGKDSLLILRRMRDHSAKEIAAHLRTAFDEAQSTIPYDLLANYLAGAQIALVLRSGWPHDSRLVTARSSITSALRGEPHDMTATLQLVCSTAAP